MTPRHPTLGSLLRGLRTRNNWTLKEMSERSGIPLSTLSKVEHDRLTLTYDKLLQLSQRLFKAQGSDVGRNGRSGRLVLGHSHASEQWPRV